MTALVPLSGGVVLNSIAQISLRYGAADHHTGPVSRNFWIGLWVVCFALATLLWLIALDATAISYAYPLLGAGYVLVTLLARVLLKEQISTVRWLSILVIIAGVLMVGVDR
jgi:multidrug transporter EmrE-like cation transporter